MVVQLHLEAGLDTAMRIQETGILPTSYLYVQIARLN